MAFVVKDPIERGWMIIKAYDQYDGDDNYRTWHDLAAEIYCAVNLSKTYLGNKKTFVVRADTIREGSSGAKVIVAMCADGEEFSLDQIAKDLAKKLKITKYELAIVETHIPYPPHNAPGYVTQDEENPLKAGTTGHNPW